MKSTLIRTLAILMLGTSMSAFAASNPCSGTETKNSDNQKQTAKKEKKARDQKSKNQQEKSDQEKEFDRVLQGMWG